MHLYLLQGIPLILNHIAISNVSSGSFLRPGILFHPNYQGSTIDKVVPSIRDLNLLLPIREIYNRPFKEADEE